MVAGRRHAIVDALSLSRVAAQLGPTAALVWVGLQCYADGAGFAFPSYTELTKATGLSRATVARQLKRLDATGWVRRHRRARQDGGRSANGYRVFHSAAAAGDLQIP